MTMNLGPVVMRVLFFKNIYMLTVREENVQTGPKRDCPRTDLRNQGFRVDFPTSPSALRNKGREEPVAAQV